MTLKELKKEIDYWIEQGFEDAKVVLDHEMLDLDVTGVYGLSDIGMLIYITSEA